MKCDVLVVGASSAGLTAATAAAMGGASVILLDRDLDGFHHVANTLFEGMAAHSGITVSDCYLEKELQGMRILIARRRSCDDSRQKAISSTGRGLMSTTSDLRKAAGSLS